MQDSFLSLRMNMCLGRVNDRHFWNPGVFGYAMIPRCRPNSRFFFFIVTSIVYGTNRDFNFSIKLQHHTLSFGFHHYEEALAIQKIESLIRSKS